MWSKHDSEPPVVVIEIIAHRGCDRLRYPVDRHRGQQEITGDALIDITSANWPKERHFSRIQAASPAGESLSAYPSVLRFRGLDCLVTIFLLPECLIALAISSLRCGQRPRPWSSARSNLQITQVDANHWLGIVQRHERGNPGPEISALSPVALITQTPHEAVPQPGDVLIVHAHLTAPLGESVTRKRRDDDVKAGTVNAMGVWIGQEWHERQQLDERAGRAVNQNQRNAVPVSGSLEDEVDANAVELSPELCSRVQLALLRPPIELVGPIGKQLPKVLKVRPLLPSNAWSPLGQRVLRMRSRRSDKTSASIWIENGVICKDDSTVRLIG